MLWLSFIYSILTHEEDLSLINYETPKEASQNKPDKEVIDIDKK